MSTENSPYFVEVDTNGCGSCGHGRTYHVIHPDGMAGSVSYEDSDEAEKEADMLNEAFEAGQETREKEYRRLKAILTSALEQTGCDGDLCMHQWHEDARRILQEAE